MSNVKVAFLYSEVAGYFLACAKELALEAEVLIFRWPVNKEAPFTFDIPKNVTIIDRSTLSQEELELKLKDFNPSIIVCSGWMDKGYVKAAKSFRKKIPIVLTLDNHWTGGAKQRVASMVSPFYLKKIFTHAWVPGQPQAIFAKKLGFKNKYLLTNFYCADTELFTAQYENTFKNKKAAFPKRFLFVARYVEHKGIFEMWEAFIQLQKEQPSDWELWCLGTGAEWDHKMTHEKIKHIGFVQPSEMEEYVAKTGVYILPSKFEPWGVTVQEFAVSGFPLLLSNQIGAKWKYLQTGVNGFEFEAGNVEALKNMMKKITEMSSTELTQMAEKSHEIGMAYTTKMWAQNLLSIIK